MHDFNETKTLVTPTFEQVKSGRIRKPKDIHVITTWKSLHSEVLKFEFHTHWKIDYSYDELHFQRGYISTFLLIEPVLPSNTPDRHLRAARKVAAAVFGLKRFNRPVRWYEQFRGSSLFLASHKKERILLVDKDDALLWGLKVKGNPEVYEMTIDEAAKKFPNKTQQEVIELAQENSMRMRFIALRYELRSHLDQKLQKALDGIRETSYPRHKIILMSVDYSGEVNAMIESIIG
jgi:hypothetical protein